MSLLYDLYTDITSLLYKYTHRFLAPLIRYKDLFLSSLVTLSWLTVKAWAALFLVTSLFLFLVTTATLAYIALYHYLIPNYQLTVPVHFDFSSSSPAAGAMAGLVGTASSSTLSSGGTGTGSSSSSSIADSNSNSDSSLSPSSSVSSLSCPSATINLLHKQWSYSDYIAHHTDPPLPTQDRPRLLYPGQAYDLYLDLHLPDSNANQNLGMLTLHADVMHHHHLLASSTQSFIPSYTSQPIRLLYQLMWALPLALNWHTEHQHIHLRLYDQFIEHPSAYSSAIRLRLQSPHGNADAFAFQLYTATLRAQVQLSGLRYCMYHWWIPTAVVGIAMITACEMFWVALLALAAYAKFYTGGEGNEETMKRRAQEEQQQQQQDTEGGMSPGGMSSGSSSSSSSTATFSGSSSSSATSPAPGYEALHHFTHLQYPVVAGPIGTMPGTNASGGAVLLDASAPSLPHRGSMVRSERKQHRTAGFAGGGGSGGSRGSGSNSRRSSISVSANMAGPSEYSDEGECGESDTSNHEEDDEVFVRAWRRKGRGTGGTKGDQDTEVSSAHVSVEGGVRQRHGSTAAVCGVAQ